MIYGISFFSHMDFHIGKNTFIFGAFLSKCTNMLLSGPGPLCLLSFMMRWDAVAFLESVPCPGYLENCYHLKRDWINSG